MIRSVVHLRQHRLWRGVGFLLFCSLIVPISSAGEKAKFNRQVNIGEDAPSWSKLPGVDGTSHSLSDYDEAAVLVVFFTCNHCPVAQAYEPRIKQAVEDFASDKVEFVAISCSRFPADAFDKMKTHAKKREFNFDYLYDETQQTGRDYGAAVTPHIFILDRKRQIAYMGAFDDNLQADKVKHHYVRDALQTLIDGGDIDVTETKPKGCHIDYE
ncbi:MAG: thioredoxin family protein [Planctomycetota bacterium]|nr:thioredoxin family protein [Planctomycetota bacterium]MDA1212698.1 thioredoxin family protein [Planctomycetota bacterium]